MKWTLLILLICPVVLGQHNNRSGRDLQFRFGNPGARSLAFGGAFLALADDATAPVANPAGMTRTSKRSMAFEFNYNEVDNEIPYASGYILQTNIFEFDYRFNGGKAPERTFQVPYLAAIFPSGNLRYGFFVHQQANYQRSYHNDEIYYCLIASPGYPDCPDLGAESFPASDEDLSLKIVDAGGTLAYAFGEKFSLGVSLFWSKLDYRADSLLTAELVNDTALVSRLARGDDAAFGGFLGMIWQATEDLSLGMTYKHQPEFDYTASLSMSKPVPRTPQPFERSAIFKIPDSLGFGIHVAPMDQFSINMDVNRVYYSQITDERVDFSEVRVNGDLITQTIDDVTELHFGLEYVYLGLANPLSLRLGYWLDPYHAPLNNVEDSQILSGSSSDPFVRDIFFLHQFARDENHYSAGFGYTFNTKFQLDMAVQIADSSQDATISGIYRF